MEFVLLGTLFRIVGKLDAFKQLHIVRRLAPLLGALGGSSKQDVFDAMAGALASMADADVDFVLHACLALVQRQQGEAWAPVFNPGAGKLQFEDIGMPEMVQIVVKVLQKDLSGFFSEGGVLGMVGQMTAPTKG